MCINAILLILELFLLKYIYESPRQLLANSTCTRDAELILNEISRINDSGNFISDLKQENINLEHSQSYLIFFQHWSLFVKFFLCSII